MDMKLFMMQNKKKEFTMVGDMAPS